MTTYEKKHALKKLSKSDKRRAASLREEIEWLEHASERDFWPFNVAVSGEAYRQLCLRDLKVKLDAIYLDPARKGTAG